MSGLNVVNVKHLSALFMWSFEAIPGQENLTGDILNLNHYILAALPILGAINHNKLLTNPLNKQEQV